MHTACYKGNFQPLFNPVINGEAQDIIKQSNGLAQQELTRIEATPQVTAGIKEAPPWECHGQGPCGGGPFCDHPSGPQQYFSTKLPT
jgi:hypothetical protein